jgi:hypothetical protein
MHSQTRSTIRQLLGEAVTALQELKNCGTGEGGFQPGNTCARGGEGGGTDGGSRVLFEVAPDPHDEKLSARWNSLEARERTTISDHIAQKILPEVFQAVGVKAQLHQQFGGYLDDTNPSFAAVLDKSTNVKDMMDVAKLAGFALSQDSMMVVASGEFTGADKVGLITVKLPKEMTLGDVHGIYKQLRTIDDGVIQGHTTVNGQMMIVDFSGDSAGLAKKVNAKLSDQYDVHVDEGYVAFPHKGEYDYASDSGGSAGLAERREDASRFRQEAAGLIDSELRKRGKGFGGAESGPEEFLYRFFYGDPVEALKNCGIGPGGFQPGNTCARGGEGSGESSDTAAAQRMVAEPKTSVRKPYKPDVDHAGENGQTQAARVGVAAMETPPPPSVGRLPNLTPYEREVESQFVKRFESDPDGTAKNFMSLVQTMTKQGDPLTFGTDDAKLLCPMWAKGDPEQRATARATLNTPLHQTANAIAKRSFATYLDTLKPGDEILVTVGGCGAGKGYGLKNVPEALELKARSKAVWDSAGDQNATENQWVQKLAEERGLKVNYVFVHADPYQQWADPEKGVVKRAGDPGDGRMVDAKVYADSYAIGAKNHQAFYETHKDNPNANFVFLDNRGKPKLIDGVPKDALQLDRHALAKFATNKILEANAPDRVKRGALIGLRIWGDD